MGRWISLHEVESYLNCGTKRVRSAIAQGGFKAYRLGEDCKTARYVCNTDDIDAWVRTRPEYPTSERAIKKASDRH